MCKTIKSLLWNWYYILQMSNISVFPLVSSLFFRQNHKYSRWRTSSSLISLSPVLLLPWIKLQIGVTHPIIWEYSCLGVELCVLCLEIVDYWLLTRPCWNQPLDTSKKWVILYNTSPAQHQQEGVPRVVLEKWLLIEWGIKIVLITLRICFASLQMVIFAASKVDYK